MEALVQVKLHPGSRLVPARLTTEHSESSGQPVVVVQGEQHARGPAEVESVFVMHDTPIELADAAVNAGFYVLGQPRGKKGGA